MHPLLQQLRALPRSELLFAIRRAADDDRIVLWEDLPYGELYTAVRAGPITAARLGIEPNVVIGYVQLVDTPKGCAIGDLMNSIPKDDPPYPDPFK